MKSNPVRFLIFMLVLVVILTYIAMKWKKFDLETLTGSAGHEVTPVFLSTDDNQQDGSGSGAVSESDTSVPAGIGFEGFTNAENPGEREFSRGNQDFFIESRLERERVRSRQIELLQEVIQNSGSSPETRDWAQRELLALSERGGFEVEIENLLKARGFRDALVYLHEKGAFVIIKTPALTRPEAAMVVDLLVKVAGTPADGISIMTKED